MALFTPAQLAELRQLAAGMLGHIKQLLRHEDPDPAMFAAMVSRLYVGYGMRGAAFVFRAWLDEVIDASPTIERGKVRGIVFANGDGTGYADPTKMSTECRWAAAAVVARTADDQVTLYRLIDRIPPTRAGVYLLRTAEVCAGLLNAYENPESETGPVRVGDVIQLRVGCSHAT
jgi:hypothetical protein